ncbi:glycerophosphodiester phosphodiesterase [Enterococcus casseliflavus]|uniref:glycerophosphodiester phosphodiesterase n=1 Tax=Enterococcus casseliflavus TaxID=37734 RepID=UPI003D0B5647
MIIDKFRLSAHRGATIVAPENTIESINEAITLNYGAIEIDPRISRDGEIFLMHDDTVDRTSNGSGYIADMTSNEIMSLEIKSDDYPKYTNQVLRIPTFEEAIRAISNSDVIVNLDGSKVDWSNLEFTNQVISILKKYSLYDQTFFVISNSLQRSVFNDRYPDAILSWLHNDANSISTAINNVKNYNGALLSIPLSVATDAVLLQLKKSGIYFQVYGVNSTLDLDRLKVMGVPMAETDKLAP